MLVLPEGTFSRGSNDFNSTLHERSEGELGTQKISPRNRPQTPFQVKQQKTQKTDPKSHLEKIAPKTFRLDDPLDFSTRKYLTL